MTFGFTPTVSIIIFDVLFPKCLFLHYVRRGINGKLLYHFPMPGFQQDRVAKPALRNLLQDFLEAWFLSLQTDGMYRRHFSFSVLHVLFALLLSFAQHLLM